MERNVLAGITRENLMRLARDLGLPVVERNFTVFDVATGDEAFSTTTPHDIVRVARVNGYQIGARTVPGPITVEIIKAFNDFVGVDIVVQTSSHLPSEEQKVQLPATA